MLIPALKPLTAQTNKRSNRAFLKILNSVRTEMSVPVHVADLIVQSQERHR